MTDQKRWITWSISFLTLTSFTRGVAVLFLIGLIGGSAWPEKVPITIDKAFVFPPALIGDLNQDNRVDRSDLFLMNHQWLQGVRRKYEKNVFLGMLNGKEVSLDLAYIPAGSFLMGSPPEERQRETDEGPVHEVQLTKPFWMGQTEVSQAQWELVMGSLPTGIEDDGQGVGEDLPIHLISWDDAVEFTVKLSQLTDLPFRLPTEAEWEYACRGPAESATRYAPFWFGDDEAYDLSSCDYNAFFDRFLVWCGNAIQTVSVKSKEPNGYGLYHMSRNLYEFCEDWYASDFYSWPEASSPDPRCQDSTSATKVAKSSLWSTGLAIGRSASRSFILPAERSYAMSVRVVTPIDEGGK